MSVGYELFSLLRLFLFFSNRFDEHHHLFRLIDKIRLRMCSFGDLIKIKINIDCCNKQGRDITSVAVKWFHFYFKFEIETIFGKLLTIVWQITVQYQMMCSSSSCYYLLELSNIIMHREINFLWSLSPFSIHRLVGICTA